MPRRAFTMIELLVAVAVLVAIIMISAQVFQSASAVTRIAQAAGDVVQEAVVIERQMRRDLEGLSPDGILAIHSVEVPNNYNRSRWDGVPPRPSLINPNLAPEAAVRCDQLVFFVEGFEHSVGYGSNLGYSIVPGMAPKTIGQAGMIRYGHGLQFPELQRYEARTAMCAPGQEPLTGQDVDLESIRNADGLLTDLTPFHQPNVNSTYGGPLSTLWTKYMLGAGNGSAGLYDQAPAGTIGGAQPEARRWVLVRTAVALGDDDSAGPNSRQKRVYQNETMAQETLLPFDPRRGYADPENNSGTQWGFGPKAPVIDLGRVDVSAMSMADLRRCLLLSESGNTAARRPWLAGADDPDDTHDVVDGSVLPGSGDQRSIIKTLFAWTRAERQPPGNSRWDQMLTAGILGSAVSNLIVEWTWDEGVGSATGVRWPRLVDAAVKWHGQRLDPENVPVELDALLDPPPGVSDAAGDGVQPGMNTLWFGLPSITDGNGTSEPWDRRVVTFGQFAVAAPGLATNDPLFDDDSFETEVPSTAAPSLVWVDPEDNDPTDLLNANAIDELDVEGSFGNAPVVREYWAIFGHNTHQPLMDEDRDSNGMLDHDPSFTPWPTALRFTMTIHDPATNLEAGRTVQFVVALPRRMGAEQ